jgi:hypothetical protein
MILALLHSSGRENLLHIRVFSRPAQSPTARPPAAVKTKPRQLSRQSSRLLNQAASAIGDNGLREALLKLARHASDNTNRKTAK